MQKVIDTHFHIFDESKFHLIWLESVPSLSNMSLETDYRAAWQGQDRYEVIGGVHIETDARIEDKERENRYFIGLANDPASMVRGNVIFLDLLNGDVKEDMKKYEKEQAVKSVRYVLHNPDEPRGLCLQEKFIENVRALGELGVRFDACLRWEEMGDLYELAKACPDTQIIINHMGMVDITAWRDPAAKSRIEAWKTAMRGLAGLSNVTTKVSGLSGADVHVISEAVDFIFDIFGEDRIMYASNFPVCKMNIGLNDWTFAMLDISAGRGQEFQDKFFYKNAVKIYDL